MRTTFSFQATVTIDGCDSCGATLPLDPYSVFPHSGQFMVTLCPACQQADKLGAPSAIGILTTGTSVRRLKGLTDGDRVERFSYTMELRRRGYHPHSEGQVGGAERCVHCGEPLAVPPHVPLDRATQVTCKSCEQVTWFVPPPRWLRAHCPQMTHVMAAEPPTECRCPRCQGVIRVRRAPHEVRCEHCGDRVELADAPTSNDTEPRPYFARLRLSSAAARAEISSTGIHMGVFFLLVALGMFALGFHGCHEGGDAAKGGAVAAAFGGVLALVGTIVLPLALRGRRRRRAYAESIEALERQEAELAAAREGQPFR